jgi:hypothetical protein
LFGKSDLSQFFQIPEWNAIFVPRSANKLLPLFLYCLTNHAGASTVGAENWQQMDELQQWEKKSDTNILHT